MSVRGVQYALRKLETAGAIRTERSRGRSSSLYRLMMTPTLHGLHRSTLHGLHPNPARIAPPNPARIAPLTELSLEQSNITGKQQQSVRARETSDEAPTTPAAAADPIDSSSSNSKSKTGRHTCPKCERTWPKQFGAVCFNCSCDVERAQIHKEALAKMEEDSRLYEEAHRVSETAQTLNSALHGRRTLPGSWLYNQDLLALIADRDFNEVCDVVRGIGVGKLPEPEKFFADYSQHLQEHKLVEEEHKRVEEELPEIEDSLKAMKKVLFRTG